MAIFGLVCAHNEAGRYLERCLRWHLQMFDDVFVYDDGSTDDSARIARDMGAMVRERGPGTPSFLLHEGALRQSAWRAMEEEFIIEDTDWIFCFDADEFLVGTTSDPLEVRHALERQATVGHDAVSFPVEETFALDGLAPLRRVDGYWGEIRATRFVRYQRGGVFGAQKMGGGSVPTYAKRVVEANSLALLHLGYLRHEDRAVKHERYSSPTSGHGSKHVASILAEPTLEPSRFRIP